MHHCYPLQGIHIRNKDILRYLNIVNHDWAIMNYVLSCNNLQISKSWQSYHVVKLYYHECSPVLKFYKTLLVPPHGLEIVYSFNHIPFFLLSHFPKKYHPIYWYKDLKILSQICTLKLFSSPKSNVNWNF